MKYLIFTLIIGLFTLANYYVFQRIWKVMPSNTIGQIIIIAFATILVFSIVAMLTFKDQLPIWLTSTCYTIATSWLVALVYLLLFNIIQDLVCLTGLVPKGTALKYTRDNWTSFIFVLGFIGLLMVAGYMKYRNKVRVPLEISINKTIGDTDSLKILAISDLHLGYTIGDKEFKKWVDIINSEQPDIVLIAGDIIDNGLRPVNAGKYAEYFRQINAPLGIYTCPGNHEYISNIAESQKFIESAGITLLQDSVQLVLNSFYIIGRDDLSNPNRKPLSELVKNLDQSKPIILLDHQPKNLNDAAENNIDLQLSGHTHRGQFWPISFITDLMFEKSHGYLKKENTNIYVSSGLGIWGGKFRIGTQSEYVVITMKK